MTWDNREFERDFERRNRRNWLNTIVKLGYVLLVVTQFAAISSGLEIWLGIHIIFAAILALPLANVPILGGLIGVMGAVKAWGWNPFLAILLFFGTFVGIVAILILTGTTITLLARFRNMRHK